MKSRILLSFLILAAFMAVTVSSQTDGLSGSGKGVAPVIALILMMFSYTGYLIKSDGNPLYCFLSYFTPKGQGSLYEFS